MILGILELTGGGLRNWKFLFYPEAPLTILKLYDFLQKGFPMLSGYRNVLLAEEELPSSAMDDFKILATYLKKLYQKNRISQELYLYLLHSFSFICLEKIVQEKLNGIMFKWNRKFAEYLRLEVQYGKKQ